MAKRTKKEKPAATAGTTVETVSVTAAETAAPEPIASQNGQTPAAVETATPAESRQSTAAEREPNRYSDPARPTPLAKNNVAGIELRIHDRFKQMQVQFREEPSAEIQEQLKKGGWTHRPAEGIYTKQFGSHGKPLAIVEGKRLYHQLTQQLAPETVYQRG